MKRKQLNVTRPTQNSIDDAGNIVEGTSSTLQIYASVQPADRIQMESLPQLRDFKQLFVLYSDTGLNTADATTKTEADRVSYLGKEYEVITVEPWLNSVRSHYRMIVGR